MQLYRQTFNVHMPIIAVCLMFVLTFPSCNSLLVICCCTVSMFTVTFTTHFLHCCFVFFCFYKKSLTCPLLYLSSVSVRSIVSHCQTGHSPGIPKKHSRKTSGSNMLISSQTPETMSRHGREGLWWGVSSNLRYWRNDNDYMETTTFELMINECNVSIDETGPPLYQLDFEQCRKQVSVHGAGTVATLHR